MEVGKIIPFPVWMISFFVLKINFEFFGRYGELVLRKLHLFFESCSIVFKGSFKSVPRKFQGYFRKV